MWFAMHTISFLPMSVFSYNVHSSLQGLLLGRIFFSHEKIKHFFPSVPIYLNRYFVLLLKAWCLTGCFFLVLLSVAYVGIFLIWILFVIVVFLATSIASNVILDYVVNSSLRVTSFPYSAYFKVPELYIPLAL